MAKTLWQLWTEEKPKPVEYPFYDPLGERGVKMGGSVTINEIDFKDLMFTLQEIRASKRPELGDNFAFTDYVLKASPLGKDDVTAVLRCFKLTEPSRDGMPFQSVLLAQYDSLAYDQWLHDVVKDTTGKFVVDEDGGKTEFFRPDAGGKPLLSSFVVEVGVIREVIRPGVANAGLPDENKIKVERYDLWDYGRMKKDEAGQDTEEYMFVQMDLDNGWFTLLRGFEVSPHNVVLM